MATNSYFKSTVRNNGEVTHFPVRYPFSKGPTDKVEIFEDFNKTLVAGEWTTVKDSGATVAASTTLGNGVLLITSAATTADDGGSVQSTGVPFKLASTDGVAWFETRLKVSTAASVDLFAGLTIPFATDPEAVFAGADFIGFVVADTDASILFRAQKNGSSAADTDTGVDLVDDTYVTLAFQVITGTSPQVRIFVDGTYVAGYAGAEIPDDVQLGVGVANLSGNNTGTRVASVDYVYAGQERTKSH